MRFHRTKTAYSRAAHKPPLSGSPVPAFINTRYHEWTGRARLSDAELRAAAAADVVVESVRELEIYIFGEPTLTTSVGELQSGPLHSSQHKFHRRIRQLDGQPMGGYMAYIAQRHGKGEELPSSVNVMFDDMEVCVRSLVVAGSQRIMSDGGRLIEALAAHLGQHASAPIDLIGGELCFAVADLRPH